ncbi:MAG: type II toxin-antitoxin system HicA family toxin [Chloroflexi bacterium]|nr:type II toxin-antitoxin system HicA family toxin [Chloroflexota bacterium]
MSSRLPRITAAGMLRALRRDGWVLDQQSGSHAHLCHRNKPGLVTVPRHAGVTLSPKTVASILDQAMLTTDELKELL